MKILLAMDTSPESQAALAEAAARPWPKDSSFEILSVIEPDRVPASTESTRETVDQFENMVAQAVQRLQSKGWQATGGSLVDDDTKIVILDRARMMNADLIVVGSHGRSSLQRFLLGSVAMSVLRHAPCSVEIVRAKSGRDSKSLKILLATDGSECSALAASSVAARPWRAGTEIRVLSVAEVILPVTRALLELPFIASAIESARAEGLRQSQEAIASARKSLSETGILVSESHSVSPDSPKAGILAEAANWGADLIVLGSHGRRGMDRFQLGSVSEAVALHADCSVEVIRKRALPTK